MLTVLALSSLAGEALAQERAEAPSETHPVRPNRFLLMSGTAVFAASYIPAVGVAATSDRDGDGWLWAPVVGPWGDLIDREGCSDGCGEEFWNKFALITMGVAQFVGVGGVIASFIVPEKETNFRIGQAKPKPEVTVSPMHVGRAGYGVGVLGRF
jgi:hypothetical protein